ncbi:MAG: hypothetical protein Q4E37_06840 [Tissierellia bacterium]|nr:hypothetical protein [Tissierellia bacterium]
MTWLLDNKYLGDEETLLFRLKALHDRGFSSDQLLVMTRAPLGEGVSFLAQVTYPLGQEEAKAFWKRKKQAYEEDLQAGYVLLFRKEKPKPQAIGRDLREALLHDEEEDWVKDHGQVQDQILFRGEEEEETPQATGKKEDPRPKKEPPKTKPQAQDLEVLVQSRPYQEVRVRYEVEEFTQVLEVPLRRKKAIISYQALEEGVDLPEDEEIILQEERVQTQVKTYKLRDLDLRKKVVTKEVNLAWDQVKDLGED